MPKTGDTEGEGAVCPTDNTLSAFVDGGLAGGDLGLLETHLADCGDCRKLVATAVRHTTPNRPALEVGKRLHRYVIEGLLGRGAMGEVYAAFDPELQRKIAVKILDHSWSVDDTARARLSREAQAIAKVSHPNVVVVHDVGTFDDEVFIAMSLVGGGTLREWLKKGGRSLEAIVDVFIAAGRGLAAAHAQGLVHRDFKPDNVLMENDVPRVSDFGLALPPDELPKSTLAAPITSLELTVTGALVGTPAYMSPEQWGRQVIDARSDQFSFCVALYEAVTGARPFPGSTLAALFTAVTVGPRPRGAGMPAWLRRIVLRGLEVDRTRRFPSMDALCDGLTQGLHRKRRSAVWIAGGAAIGLAIGTGLFVRQQTLCRGFEGQLRGAYDQSIRARIVTALGPSGGQIVKLLDEYAGNWVTGREAACRATRVTGEQSEAALDRRVLCLDDRRQELARLSELLVKPTPELLRGAQRAVTALSSLSECADLARLTGELPAPDDPVVRKQIRAQRDELARLRVLFNAARYVDARTGLDAISAEIKRINYAPLLAEEHYLGGQLATAQGDYTRADVELREAALAAELGRNDKLRADAWVDLVESQVLAKRSEAALATYRQAEAAIGRVARPSIEARLLRSKGVMTTWQDDYDGALAIAESALAKVRTEPPGTRDERIEARLVQDVGLYMLVKGHPDEALAYTNEALAILHRNYGTDHPYLADIYDSLMVVNQVRGDMKAALSSTRRALELRRAKLGPTHVRVLDTMKRVAEYELYFGRVTAAKSIIAEIDAAGGGQTDPRKLLEMRARIAMMEKRWADAESVYRQLLATPVPAGTNEDVARAGWRAKLGDMMGRQPSKVAEGDKLYRAALDETAKLLGADDQDTSHERLDYARSQFRHEQFGEAKTEVSKVLAAYARKNDKNARRLFDALSLLGMSEWKLGQHAAARGHFEEAIALVRGNTQLADEPTGRVLLTYAQFRIETGERGPAIVALLDECKPLVATADPPDPVLAKELADAYASAKR